MKSVAIVDYGLANIRSVVNAFSCFDADIKVAAHPDDLSDAAAIVLPGVGSFDAGMRGLHQRGHVEALDRHVRSGGRPFLGICLGMQFLLEGSEEGQEPGLGWLRGRCRRFRGSNLKVPHIGWNEVKVADAQSLFRGMETALDFYFAHSYYAPAEDDLEHVGTASCDYGGTFVAALSSENIHAVQFHPEKSQLAGMKLIETFLSF